MSNNLPTLYQQYIHLSRYSRWDKNEERRESYEETVSRYFDFFEEHTGQDIVTPELRRYLEDKVLGLGVMPSMRCLMTAGPALKRENVAGYNCSYLPVDHPRAFDECLYILMNGTGVGFSVERDYINKLPAVSETLEYSDSVINVGDSKEGWARGLRELIGSLYQGSIPQWNMDKIRPAGALLKVFGGRASGPEPLEDLFRFTVDTFKDAAGRKLTSLQCHDIMCKIGDVVVVGGVRRSALISLSNLSDMRMRNAKVGEWHKADPQRALANNSVCYTEKPDNIGVFMEEWLALYMSKNGERGIFNRQAAKEHVRKSGRRDPDHDFGTNPCSEIILRPNQFCNLTEVVCRPSDTKETLMDKIKAATILGTIQSTLTNFKYLRKIWTKNTEEERLLGVSLTGILDCPLLTEENPNLEELLNDLREYAVEVNREYADLLGINPSASITCVKPSGTVSQLVDSASGIHARHNDYYIRRIRMSKTDSIYDFLKDSGVQVEDDLMDKHKLTAVFAFPMKAPKDAVLRNDKSAMEQLENWLVYQRHWCEHKPSVTISVKDKEWVEVGAWVWKHFDEISGVSFLPHDNHTYQQAPYEDCDKSQYEALLKQTPKTIDWTKFIEEDDNTIGQQTLACTAGSCEI